MWHFACLLSQISCAVVQCTQVASNTVEGDVPFVTAVYNPLLQALTLQKLTGRPGMGNYSYSPFTQRRSGSSSAVSEMPFGGNALVALRHPTCPAQRPTLALSSLSARLHVRRTTSAFLTHLFSGPHRTCKVTTCLSQLPIRKSALPSVYVWTQVCLTECA